MKHLLLALLLCGPWVVSYYGEDFRGQTTATGALFDPDAYTAACYPSLLGRQIVVCNEDGRCVQVACNDTGPWCSLEPLGHCGPRWLDLSEAAFAALWPTSRGRVFDAKGAIMAEIEHAPQGTEGASE